MYKAICPKNSEHTEFVTTVNVVQEWRVSSGGDFLDVTDSCLEVTHRQDPGKFWTCHECGAEAAFVRGFPAAWKTIDDLVEVERAQPATQAKED